MSDLLASPHEIQNVPKGLFPYVIEFCKSISTEQPVFVPVKPYKDGVINECIWNVRNQVEKEGGEVVLGWSISEWYGVMMEATFHVVLRTKEGKLIDLTPNEFMMSEILFLPDPKLVYKETQIDSINFPLISDIRINEFISNQREIFKLENTGDLISVPGSIVLSEEDADRRGYLAVRPTFFCRL
jgi:hypothetical protein